VRAAICENCGDAVAWAATFWCEHCEVRVCVGCFTLEHPELIVPSRADLRRPGLPRGGELVRAVAGA